MVEAAARRHLLPVQEVGEDAATQLPAIGTRHWVPRHKAAVVAAVRQGVLSLRDACDRYMLTEEEFYSWADAIDQHGIDGLRSSMRSERRKSVRQLTAEPAVAMLHATEGIDCRVTDISDHGARIECDAPVAMPNTFELRFSKSGRSWWVSVVWARGEAMGVHFNNPLPPPWVIESGLGAWLLGSRRTVVIDRLDAR